MNYAATILSTALERCVGNVAAKQKVFFSSRRVEVNEKLIVAVVILILL